MHAAISCHGPDMVASSSCHGNPGPRRPSQRTGLDDVAENALANAAVGTGCAGRSITTHSISGSGASAPRSVREGAARVASCAAGVSAWGGASSMPTRRHPCPSRRPWHSHRPNCLFPTEHRLDPIRAGCGIRRFAERGVDAPANASLLQPVDDARRRGQAPRLRSTGRGTAGSSSASARPTKPPRQARALRRCRPQPRGKHRDPAW